MTEKPLVASRKPFYRELRAGQSLLWCRCGRSKRQPFCDGRSHVGTGHEPVRYCAVRDEEVLLCGCKQTGTPPFCDGSHSNLPGGYRDEASDVERPSVSFREPDAAGFARLDGDCYVVTPTTPSGGYACTTLVSPSLGARHQSQFHVRLDAGESPALSSSAGDIVLWVRSGVGTIAIGERSFNLAGGTGVSVRRDETFRLACTGEPLEVYISVCPGTTALEEHSEMRPDFDSAWPERLVGIDQESRHAMGPRWFQMLVEERHGLRNTAQFIGHIPLSRAEMHRHLYEEALIIVSGAGTIWNETSCARVGPGDVIFFPRKHVHSLECTAEGGMDVVGLIHPGTNPGINY